MIFLIVLFYETDSSYGLSSQINITINEAYDEKDNKILNYEISPPNSSFRITSANINTDDKALQLNITNSSTEAQMPNFKVQIDRDILDSKNYTKDLPFTVSVGSNVIERDNNQRNQTMPFYKEISRLENSRTLQIPIVPDYKSITIIGTEVLDENKFIYQMISSLSKYALVLSLVIAVASTIILLLITLKYLTLRKKDKMFDILLEHDWYPSLPRFQLFLWTIIVVFAFIWVTSFKLLSANVGYGDIPYNLLLLMGLSASTYSLSKIISADIHKKVVKRPKTPYSYKTMLYEGNKKSLARIQFFGWTFISIIFYVIILALQMIFAKNYVILSLPDLPTALVILMGIGEGVFIGGKYRSINRKIFHTRS